MCRNIKILFNFDPAATDVEIKNAAQQFVRKLSGFNQPSQSNEESFSVAVNEISASAKKLLDSLTTNATPKDRQEEAAKAHARAVARFGS